MAGMRSFVNGLNPLLDDFIPPWLLRRLLPGSRRLLPTVLSLAASAEIVESLDQRFERLCFGRIFRGYVDLNAFRCFGYFAFKLLATRLHVFSATVEHLPHLLSVLLFDINRT
jgi:hypothetical protein